ncbi:hypothetical protein [Burkholderia cenocepacia]|uniref:hypothetical protein n=1 Tax=Burkholderia cenocepacia TaxID=95486 RepID=UPI00264EA39F|nr:hypothetical protein [Burkholderia cenocepacia]MDN7537041.1 hypothetical protein [Burkholderia cenocepacia]
MLPPDDVLVAHLTLLGFVGWHDGAFGDGAWSLWYGGLMAWQPGHWPSPDIMPWKDCPGELLALDHFPRPLLRKLATALLEADDAAA